MLWALSEAELGTHILTAAPKITVVVPTYNERDNLPLLTAQLASLGIANFHILVVDDNYLMGPASSQIGWPETPVG